MSCHSLLPLFERNHKPCFVSLDVAICWMFDLVYPHGRQYKLPFKSRNCILDIVLCDQLVLFDHSLLPFLFGYFFIDGRIYINDVTQQCHISRVCLRPLSFFGSLIILFFNLEYSSSTILFSSSKALSFAMVSLTREYSGSSFELSSPCSLEWYTSQVHFHDYKHIIISKTY